MRQTLELGRDGTGGLAHGHSEADQGRRNVELTGLVLKRAAHRVLAAYRADAELHLRLECTEKCRQRLPPALAVSAGALKIFLECEINILELCARGDELADRFDNRKICAVIRALLGYKRIVSERHERAVVGVLLLDGYLLHHRLNGRQLILAAERHEHRARAYRRIETLGKSALRADV